MAELELDSARRRRRPCWRFPARQILLPGAALICALGSIPGNAAASVVLDPLLGKLLSDCDGSKSFDQFRRSIAARHGHDASGKRLDPNAPIMASAEIKSAMGPITSVNKGEYTEVNVPLSGTLRSLPVSAVDFVFGNENGINMASVRFATSRSEVVKVIGRDVARAKRLLRQRVRAGETGADQSATIDIKDGQGRLVCDTSN
ncbi:hypothetical protein [Methylobacterium sp. A54F]